MTTTTEHPQTTAPAPVDALPKKPASRPRSRRMLAAAAYSEATLPSLRLARSSRHARRIGRILLTLLIGSFLLAAMAPWQQSVTGNGNVVAFAPGERPQNIEAPIKGRIVGWSDGVYENARVREGDIIAEIQDIDPNLMPRLQGQLKTVEKQVESTELQLINNEQNLASIRQVHEAYKARLETYKAVKTQVVGAADAMVDAAQNKFEAATEEREIHRAALTQLDLDYKRQAQLYDEDIVAGVKLQIAERKHKEAIAKLKTADAYVRTAENELAAKRLDRLAKEEKAQADIESATALVEDAASKVAKAESEVNKTDAELSKARKEEFMMQTKVARQENQLVRAPFDGVLTRISANQGGQMVKEGDLLCVIVPDTRDRSVQVWLDGNDAPLVEPGRHVRLQFEGWPAIQFAGWPSVAVGTFGGTVVSVDATDDAGRFRVLVRPDEDTSEPWPDERYLRQGVKTHAWVLLEQVPLWYEIWRNMNGFPPVVTPDKAEEKAKKPKLPK